MSGRNEYKTNFRFYNILIFLQSGVVPTVPVLPNITQQNARWRQATDLNDGEWAINQPDNLVFIRIGQQIFSFNISQLANVIALAHNRLHALNSTLDHYSNIPQGDLMMADNHGLPADSGIVASSISGNNNAGVMFQLENNTDIVVNNDYQYNVKGAFTLISGSITLYGNAQLNIF